MMVVVIVVVIVMVKARWAAGGPVLQPARDEVGWAAANVASTASTHGSVAPQA